MTKLDYAWRIAEMECIANGGKVFQNEEYLADNPRVNKLMRMNKSDLFVLWLNNQRKRVGM